MLSHMYFTSTLRISRTAGFRVGLKVRECARRVLDLCKNKDKIKKERQEAKKLRTKIVGVGLPEDNYGEKFQAMAIEGQKTEGSHYGGGGYGDYEGKSKKEGQIVAYDPYQSTKPLSEKIGVILDDVDKVNDGDNADTIKQKLAGNKNKSGWVKKESYQ